MGEKSSSRIDNDLETWFRSLHTFYVESRLCKEWDGLDKEEIKYGPRQGVPS